MMPMLIQGLKQPGEDIDVYLRPLVEEFCSCAAKKGVHVWDKQKQDKFNLRALLFITIHD
jgi:hypothetical protein